MTILVFILDYSRKINDKIFQKIQKIPILGAILGNFYPNMGKNDFSWKKGLCQFLNNPIIYMVKKIWKKEPPIPDKNAKLLVVRQTENSDFIGPCVGQGSKKSNLEQSATFFEREKNNRKLNPFIKTMLHGSNIHYSKVNQKGNWKKHIKFPLELQKMRPRRHLVQLSTWKGWLGILNIYSHLNSIKTKWIHRLLNPTNAFWKDLMLYWLNLIFNSNHYLVLFRQTDP